MKQTIRILALAMVLMLAIFGMALAETNKTVVLVGTNPEFAPFEFVGDDGEVQGIDIDIIKAIFEKIDPSVEVQIESMAFDGLIPAMASGKIDLAIAAMSVTEERKQSVLFSDTYIDATQKIIVKEGSDITSEADLDGKKIGVQLGTTGDLYSTDTFTNAEISRFDKALDAVQDVASGRLDAVVVDEGPANTYASQVPGLVILEDRMSDEQYAIALKLDATELLEQVNAALAELKEDGTIAAAIAKYIK